MAKLNKFADKVKKIKRTATVDFPTDGGEVISFKVESISQNTMEAINRKYDGMEPPVPTKRVPAKGGRMKIVENPDDPKYVEQLGKIRQLRLAEFALFFLAEDERPEGELEEQLKAMIEVELAGFIPRIMDVGFEISGFRDDEDDYEGDIEEAKNS